MEIQTCESLVLVLFGGVLFIQICCGPPGHRTGDPVLQRPELREAGIEEVQLGVRLLL